MLDKVQFSGPTNFNKVLKRVVDMATEEEVSQMNQHYWIMLIITDGCIHDMDPTIDEIVRGSSLPLSIIIVGVGGADFSKMDILDADEVPLYSKKHKKYMERDIVQFVPFRDFKENPMALARETLDEVPRQLLSFMESKSIRPLPPKRKDIPRQLSIEQRGSKAFPENKC